MEHGKVASPLPDFGTLLRQHRLDARLSQARLPDGPPANGA
jgi:hypothetical protein